MSNKIKVALCVPLIPAPVLAYTCVLLLLIDDRQRKSNRAAYLTMAGYIALWVLSIFFVGKLMQRFPGRNASQ